MEYITKKAVVEAVDTAKEYALKLEDLINAVKRAEEQIDTSSQRTIEDIDSTFDLLTATLTEALNKRRDLLRTEALKIREHGLSPLRACCDVISEKLKVTKLYIEEGRDILRGGGLSTVDHSLRFSEQASLLGSLPAVPNLEEVPELSFQCSELVIQTDLCASISAIGRVSRMGPVQVTEVEEKPGALLVHWEEVDFERMVDVHSFRLQLAYGDIQGQEQLLASNFHDAYLGPEGHHLVRDLKPGVPYTFRVCCRVEGDSDWSAWSLPRVAATNQEPFCWDQGNLNYKITNENKLASKATSEQSVLLSSAAQFGPGHSIEFTVLECGVGCSDEGLGLVDGYVTGETLLQPGSLFINTQGCVYVNGSEKATKLPRLEKGSKVCFTCEHIRENRIRVNIDSNNKTVTYDWNINSPNLKLYFALCFGERGWKILVE